MGWDRDHKRQYPTLVLILQYTTNTKNYSVQILRIAGLVFFIYPGFKQEGATQEIGILVLQE